MPQPDLIERFGAETYDYNDISASRRRQQPRAIRRFEAWLHDQHQLQITAAGGQHLGGYLGTRVADGIAASTVRKELNMIRPFYGWLWGQKLITPEQLMEVREVKPPRGSNATVPRPYNEREQARFWRELALAYPYASDVAPTPGNPSASLDRADYWLARWRREQSSWPRVQPYFRRVQIEAIVSLAYYGGIRQDEIFRLKLEDMHPENAYVVVWSARKNAEGHYVWRAVPWVTPEMRDAVARWLDLRAEIAPEHDRPWLTLRPANHALNPMQKRAFGVLACDIGSGWQFHRLRHTAATEMLRSGMKIQVLKEILGHATIQQTLRYAKIVEGDVLLEAKRVENGHSRRMTLIRYPEAA